MNRGDGTMIVSIIGDEDTVTGMLLTGIGERNVKGETNFYKVDSSINYIFKESTAKDIESAFKKFVSNP